MKLPPCFSRGNQHFGNGLGCRRADRHFLEVPGGARKSPLGEHISYMAFRGTTSCIQERLPLDLSFPVECESMWFCNLFKTRNSYCVFSILIFCVTTVINIQSTVRPDKTSYVFPRKSICGSNQASSSVIA